MPTFRQLVASNPGSAWMRTPNYQQQLAGSVSALGPERYLASLASQNAAMTAADSGQTQARQQRLASPLSVGYGGSYHDQYNALGDRFNDLRAEIGRIQNSAPAGTDTYAMTAPYQQQINDINAQRSQLTDAYNQANISRNGASGSRQVNKAKQSNANFFQGMANRNGGSWQSTQQDYLRRAGEQQAARFAQEGGPAAQWGWDQGSATWQPQNQSARNATFGSLAGPSASYQAAMNAQQQAYAGPAQQAARTRQMIYGYGG